MFERPASPNPQDGRSRVDQDTVEVKQKGATTDFCEFVAAREFVPGFGFDGCHSATFVYCTIAFYFAVLAKASLSQLSLAAVWRGTPFCLYLCE